MEARREAYCSASSGGRCFVCSVMEPYASILGLMLRSKPRNQSLPDGSAPESNPGGNFSLASADGAGFTPFLSAQPARRRDSASNAPGPLTIENISPGRLHLSRRQPSTPAWYVSVCFVRRRGSHSADALRWWSAEAQQVGCAIRVVLRIRLRFRACDDTRCSDQNPTAGLQRALYVYALPESKSRSTGSHAESGRTANIPPTAWRRVATWCWRSTIACRSCPTAIQRRCAAIRGWGRKSP